MTSDQTELHQRLAEPYALAVVTWPAVIGLMAPMPEAWSIGIQSTFGLWLAAMHLAAYSRGRGAGFGNAMLFNSGVVALACWSHPSPWALAWLPVLLIGLNAAQRARLGRPEESVESHTLEGRHQT